MSEAWIQTYTGRPFPLLAPDAADIDLHDIAHALSNLCRFAGHTREFYSVAQHSVLVSWNVPAEDALAALFHDAPEAYIVDLPRPLKRSGLVDGYKTVETAVWRAVAEHFFLFEEIPDSVKVADNRALFTEQRDLMGRQAKPWSDPHPPFDATLHPLTPKLAKALFLARYYELTQERGDRVRAAMSSNGVPA